MTHILSNSWCLYVCMAMAGYVYFGLLATHYRPAFRRPIPALLGAGYVACIYSLWFSDLDRGIVAMLLTQYGFQEFIFDVTKPSAARKVA